MLLIGTNIQETQKNFLKSAIKFGHWENNMLRAILFRKDVKHGVKINDRKNNKADCIKNNSQEDNPNVRDEDVKVEEPVLQSKL